MCIRDSINGAHADSFADGISMIMAVTKKIYPDIKQVQIFQKHEYSDFENEVKSFRPNVIGFTSVSSQFSFVNDLCTIAKKILPNVVTVCGGIHTTLYPESVSESKELDVIFRGDSEGPFLDFLEKVESRFKSLIQDGDDHLETYFEAMKNKIVGSTHLYELGLL